jgi:hypothetical protein
MIVLVKERESVGWVEGSLRRSFCVAAFAD